MDFKVDYVKLEDIGYEIESQTYDLIETFDELIEIIDGISEGWQGIDYENFKTASTSFIKEKKNTTNQLEYISGYMKKAAMKYSERDEGWKRQIQKIGEDEKWNKV